MQPKMTGDFRNPRPSDCGLGDGGCVFARHVLSVSSGKWGVVVWSGAARNDGGSRGEIGKAREKVVQMIAETYRLRTQQVSVRSKQN